jgi:translation initiation factor IF-1
MGVCAWKRLPAQAQVRQDRASKTQGHNREAMIPS